MNVAPGIPHTGQRYEGAWIREAARASNSQMGWVYDDEFKNNLFHGEGALKTKKTIS